MKNTLLLLTALVLALCAPLTACGAQPLPVPQGAAAQAPVAAPAPVAGPVAPGLQTPACPAVTVTPLPALGAHVLALVPAARPTLLLTLADGTHPLWAGGAAGLMLRPEGLDLAYTPGASLAVWDGFGWVPCLRWT